MIDFTQGEPRLHSVYKITSQIRAMAGRQKHIPIANNRI